MQNEKINVKVKQYNKSITSDHKFKNVNIEQ